MRGACDHFSEGRLALVLFLTGWLPLYGGPIGGLLGFLVAVWVVRVSPRSERFLIQPLHRAAELSG
jgi:hypothetical protein